MSDSTRFDPRFDPAFQPGYEGPLVDAAPPRRQAAAQAGSIGTPPAARHAPEPVPATRPAVVDVDDPDLEDEPASRRPNPFLIALGAVAVLLVGGGVYLLMRARELFEESQSSPQLDYVTLQTLLSASPLVIMLGIATAVGILFVLAARWRRR